MRKAITISLLAFSLCITLALLSGCNSSNYSKAVNLFNEEKYEEAKALFDELGDYEDSYTYSRHCEIALRPKCYKLSSVKVNDAFGYELKGKSVSYVRDVNATLTFLDHKYFNGYEYSSSVELDFAGKTYTGRLSCGPLFNEGSITWDDGKGPTIVANAVYEQNRIKYLSDNRICITFRSTLDGYVVSYEIQQYYSPID